MRKLEYIICENGKRSYEDEREAERALGRVRTKRQRFGDSHGTRRGLKVESRFYYHDVCDGFHLTEQSRRDFESVAA